ncbi:hypothetical protein QTN94_19245 [Vibrio sp. M250220]|uniref:hypothetical protein n=1 Tax=Vibrio sp. M250220 TaxID=3020894 RepID=UPI002F42A6AE
MKDDPVDTGCGNCFVLASGDAVSLGPQMFGSINMGAGVNIGQGVNINMGSGVSLGQGVSFGDRSSTSPSSNFTSSASHLSQVNDPYRSEPLLFSQTQTIDKILSDSLALECSLEEEMAKNMQHVLITL